MPAAAVSDAYAALNQALHPSLQYLHHLRGGDEAVLTARADGPRLLAASKAILEGVERERPAGGDRHRWAATPRNRMRWLSPFFSKSLAQRFSRRALGTAVAALAALAVGTALVLEAVEYHPIYVQRMSQLKPQPSAPSPGDTDERPQTSP